MSQFFASGGQIIGASASASVLPMNIQGWFPLELIGWISLQFKRLSRALYNTTVQKHVFFSAWPSLWSSSHIYLYIQDYWEKNSFDYMDLCWQIMSLLFNTLSRCHSFSSKVQASFNFVAAVTVSGDFGAQENKVCHCFHFSPFYLPWSDETGKPGVLQFMGSQRVGHDWVTELNWTDGTRYHDLRFLNVEF